MASATVTLPASTAPSANLRDDLSISFKVPPGAALSVLGVLEETVAVTQFADGGAAVGTYTMAGALPAGAVILGTRVLVPAGFAGDTTAALQIGDGSTVARYNTSTANVFATAAGGVESGVPSGNKLQVAAVRPVLTVTSSADFTAVVSNGSGIVTVAIYYIPTV